MRKLIEYIRRLFLKTATNEGGVADGNKQREDHGCADCDRVCSGGCKGCVRFRNHDSGKAE